MQSDGTIAGSIMWTLWYAGEIMFKWIPGVAVSFFGIQGPDAVQQLPNVPPITEPVNVVQIYDFLQTAPAYDSLYHAWIILVSVSGVVSAIFGSIAIYSLVRIFQIRRAEFHHFEEMAHTVAAGDIPHTHLRWNKIKEQAYGPTEQDWRLSILEADIMLNELLDTMGFRGETMAEKMRSVDRASFNTIDLAWEAHRARNRIAHEGAAHQLSGRETQHIIGLYEKVFREFKFIE